MKAKGKDKGKSKNGAGAGKGPGNNSPGKSWQEDSDVFPYKRHNCGEKGHRAPQGGKDMARPMPGNTVRAILGPGHDAGRRMP